MAIFLRFPASPTETLIAFWAILYNWYIANRSSTNTSQESWEPAKLCLSCRKCLQAVVLEDSCPKLTLILAVFWPTVDWGPPGKQLTMNHLLILCWSLILHGGCISHSVVVSDHAWYAGMEIISDDPRWWVSSKLPYFIGGCSWCSFPKLTWGCLKKVVNPSVNHHVPN